MQRTYFWMWEADGKYCTSVRNKSQWRRKMSPGVGKQVYELLTWRWSPVFYEGHSSTLYRRCILHLRWMSRNRHQRSLFSWFYLFRNKISLHPTARKLRGPATFRPLPPPPPEEEGGGRVGKRIFLLCCQAASTKVAIILVREIPSSISSLLTSPGDRTKWTGLQLRELGGIGGQERKKGDRLFFVFSII